MCFVSDFKYVTKNNSKENDTNGEFLENVTGKESQKEFGLLRSAGIACFQNKLTLEGEHQSTYDLLGGKKNKTRQQTYELAYPQALNLDVGKIDLMSTGSF